MTVSVGREVRNDDGDNTNFKSDENLLCGRIYIHITATFPKSYTQLSTTVTDLNGHHHNFQKDSWQRVPHSCHKQSMLQLHPVEETPALPAAMSFNQKNAQER